MLIKTQLILPTAKYPQKRMRSYTSGKNIFVDYDDSKDTPFNHLRAASELCKYCGIKTSATITSHPDLNDSCFIHIVE